MKGKIKWRYIAAGLIVAALIVRVDVFTWAVLAVTITPPIARLAKEAAARA